MTESPRSRTRRRGLSVRMQLTLSYAALLMLAGLAFAAVGVLILRFIPEGNLIVVGGAFAPGRDDLIAVFVRYALWALVALAVIGLGGGWLLAGRMLRPLTRIMHAAELARDGSLSHRIDMPGRQNELAELADTVDDMLAAIERSVEEQRRFAANASHELRTPHAVMRTMLEVARADPTGRDIEVLLQRLELTNERSIALIESLLSLARIDHRAQSTQIVELRDVVADVVAELGDIAEHAGVTIDAGVAAGAVQGDAALIRQLVANLVHNAVVHNHPNGSVRITATSVDAGMQLEVVNTGDVLDPAIAATLTEPFVRGGGRARSGTDDHGGSGLGLAIVASIARAHGTSVALAPRRSGGLEVRVLLPGPRPQSDQVSPTYPFPRTAS